MRKRRAKKDKQGRQNKRKKSLYAFLKKHIKRKLPGQREAEERLRLLYPGQSIEEEEAFYYEEKLRLVLAILALGLCLALYVWLNPLEGGRLEEGRFLSRGNKAYETELRLEREGETRRAVKIFVEPKSLTAEESRELLAKVSKEIDRYILGENSSLDEVRSDLKLIRSIEGTPIHVSWDLDSYEVLNLDGSLREEKLTEEGSLVELTATLSCFGEEEICRRCVRVLPPILGKEESFDQALTEEIWRLQEESKEKDLKELPLAVQGEEVLWKEKGSSLPLALFLLTLLCGIAVYGARDQELKQRVKEREFQMKGDYARIVSKLVLLMGAGATIRRAWELIVQDYQSKREEGTESLRYAYEEMALASHEMRNGIAEARAYENFGLRCQLPCYLKLSALLEQNLSKGSSGLSKLLGAEVQEAFSQRKELARLRGEEASTKLLLPMILMLAVVMMLILIPAGMSMKIS